MADVALSVAIAGCGGAAPGGGRPCCYSDNPTFEVARVRGMTPVMTYWKSGSRAGGAGGDGLCESECLGDDSSVGPSGGDPSADESVDEGVVGN